MGTPVTGGRPVGADGGSEKTPPAKSRLRRIAGTAGGFAVVAVVFAVILPRIADYSEVWDVMTSLTTASCSRSRSRR